MIAEISIKNFKSIADLSIAAKDLTLFTGMNSTGKSTIIQALLILRQSFEIGYIYKHQQPSIFLGNSDTWVQLGNFQDIFNENARKEEGVKIEITIDYGGRLTFISDQYMEENRSMSIVSGNCSNYFTFASCNLFTDRFQYLESDRIRPQEDYPRFPGKSKILGKKGQFTAHLLAIDGNQEVPLNSPFLIEEMKDKRVNYLTLVSKWLKTISANIEISVKENNSTNMVELSYFYSSASVLRTSNRKPQNVGFGITHTLPILVAVLFAKPNDIIIIENPETHLHPRGQSKLGELFAIAAQGGVQIFVETHSDHILNGIRVAAKKKLVESTKVGLYYFEKDPESGNSTAKQLKMDQQGGIDNWPDGFFDEWDNRLFELL